MITLDPVEIARRSAHSGARPLVERDPRLLQRIALLAEPDRLLMQMVFVDQLSLRRAAAVLAIPPGTASRRARRLHRRIHQPLVTALLSHPDELPPELRRLAIAHFVLRKRMRHLAIESGRPTGQVRAAIDFLKGWCRAVTLRRARE